MNGICSFEHLLIRFNSGVHTADYNSWVRLLISILSFSLQASSTWPWWYQGHLPVRPGEIRSNGRGVRYKWVTHKNRIHKHGPIGSDHWGLTLIIEIVDNVDASSIAMHKEMNLHEILRLSLIGLASEATDHCSLESFQNLQKSFSLSV